MLHAAKPRFREISDDDIDAVADLLTRGFVYRPREYWIRGLQRQRLRALPADVPRYGYMLENEDKPVGCLLLIYAAKDVGSESAIFCNVSSWYVDPEFRNYASLLASVAQKRKDVTYFNVTPAAFTWPVIEAQGFERYCAGLFFSVAGFSLAGLDKTIERVTPDTRSIEGLPDAELELLVRHAGYAAALRSWSAARQRARCPLSSCICENAAASFRCPPCSSAIAAASTTTSNAPPRLGAF